MLKQSMLYPFPTETLLETKRKVYSQCITLKFKKKKHNKTSLWELQDAIKLLRETYLETEIK